MIKFSVLRDLFLPNKKRIRDKIFFVGEVSSLTLESLYSSVTRPFYFKRLVQQIVEIGVGSISITVVIGFVMGLVMTLNFGYGLQKFGGTLYVPGIVVLSLAREMAPIFTSLLIAGRVGSGIAAQIGAMNVTQQIDALRALGTSPVRVLVVPRLLALMISLPLLSALSLAFGIVGGLIVSINEFGITPGFYFNRITEVVKLHDFTSGILKCVFFAVIIVAVASYKGLNTKDGTQGVGQSTTWVVVTSSITILIVDYVLSKLFLVFWIP